MYVININKHDKGKNFYKMLAIMIYHCPMAVFRMIVIQNPKKTYNILQQQVKFGDFIYIFNCNFYVRFSYTENIYTVLNL